MERKSKKKVMAIVAALVIVILVSVQGIILLLQKRYAGSQDLSKIANAENEEMMIERNELTGEEKKQKMKDLSASWDPNIVETQTVNLYSEAELEVNDGEQVQVPIPIPKGYVLSGLEEEKTVGSGVVIYEGDQEVTTSNKGDAQKNRNQWVWVPIYDVKEIYGTDSNGKIHGKRYNYSSDPRTELNWKEEEGVMTISDPESDREPDLVTGYDKDSYLPAQLLEKEAEELEKELTTNFEKTIKSIEKYGGFYIGRYETGGLSGEAKVVKLNNDISKQTWYTMYEKSKALSGKNRNVETSMIYGCLWDATMQWLMDTKAAELSELKNSTNWGNYLSSSFKYTNSQEGVSNKRTYTGLKVPTGSAEQNKKNNIYDMAGNVWDATLQAGSTASRVYRGGYYYDYSSSAYGRDSGSPDRSLDYIGCRAALFVALGTDNDE